MDRSISYQLPLEIWCSILRHYKRVDFRGLARLRLVNKDFAIMITEIVHIRFRLCDDSYQIFDSSPYIWKNIVNGLNIRVFTSLFIDPKYKPENLFFGRLGESDVRILISYLRHNKSLRRLRINVTNSLKPLTDYLQESENINELILRFNPWETDLLTKCLKSNKSIERLNLHNNYLRDDNITTLMYALSKHEIITHLNLSYNFIKTNIGYVAITNYLMIDTNLVSLNLAGNQLNDDALISFIYVLSNFNKTLRNLNLSSNPITQKGVEALFKMFETHKNIRICDISSTLCNKTYIREYLRDKPVKQVFIWY